MSFVRENASMIGFCDHAIKDIELATEEAVSNVFKHAYSTEEHAEFHIICERLTLGMKIIIKDKGQPFDPTVAPAYDPVRLEDELSGRGLGLYLMRQFMDDISFHILGREGKEVHLVKYLGGERDSATPAADIAQEFNESRAITAAPPESFTFSVRLACPSEAVEISKCAYDAYHYSYGHEHIYYPERLKEMLKSGTMISAVAVLDGEPKTIMAHMALILDEPGAGNAEIGMAFTKRQYQNQGCGQAIGAFLLKYAVRKALHGILIDCTTAHVYSQKAALSAGAKECCILLGIDPEAQSWKHFESQSQRVSNIINHIKVPSTSAPDPVRTKTVHAPAHHREMIKRIYANLGEDPIYLDDDCHAKPPDSLSVIEVHTGKAYQQTATIEIKAFGADIVQQIGGAVKRLCLEKLEIVYLYLNLQDPLTAVFTAQLETFGFFFAGIIPRLEGGDRLELQYLNNVLIGYDQIQLQSDFAKELLAYIQAHDPAG
jgi:anti-sigma regulatory factor (Ser/Thr protein kinase)/GNAT superfamily N-acetyltransferase